MHLGRVIGTVVASQKVSSLEGLKLLVLQPLADDGSSVGSAIIAVDSVGAGGGEHVFFVRGREASLPFLPDEVSTDASVVGIIDHWNTESMSRRNKR
tara:strand:- start:8971 stop:9261 length:291 start_codon:yes stop_codon:yes gene_type:complete